MAGPDAVKLEAPPPRQRVIERDGRLVVIDSGAPLKAGAVQPRRGRFEQTAYDGRGVLTTQGWYDLKGPRRLSVDGLTGRLARSVPILVAAIVLALIGLAFVFPAGLILVPLVAQPKPWRGLRRRTTAYLDRFDPA